MINMISENHAIVNEGEFRNIKYTVCFLRGGYYTCYLDVSNTVLYSVDYNEIDLPVHWGLTYGDHKYPWEKEKDFDKYIIGWDYGHCDDAYDNEMGKLIFGDSYHENISVGCDYYNIHEIAKECIEAINAIYEMEGK